MRWSAVERTLWIDPRTAKRPFRAPLVVGEVVGTVTLAQRSLTIELRSGSLAIERVVVAGKARDWRTTVASGATATLALPAGPRLAGR